MHLDGGVAPGGARVLPQAWIQNSVEPQARIDEDDDYGYLWWLKLPTKATQFYGPYMSGSGGNRVHLLPAYNAVVVVTTKNFREREAHPWADRIVSDWVIPALQSAGESP